MHIIIQTFLTDDAFEKVKYRQNVDRTTASLAGKIDVNAGPNMNISFGASGSYSDRLRSILGKFIIEL